MTIPLSNMIDDVAPWMIQFFQGGIEEAQEYAIGSSVHRIFQCPDCKQLKEKPKRICDLYKNRSIGCICKDHKSYPEKFMKSLLDQLNIVYIWGFAAQWLKGYKSSKYPALFDFYLPEFALVIEMDGGIGHGKRSWRDRNDAGDSLVKDEWKDKRASEHGIEVIRVNSDKSSLEHLRLHITTSLADKLDLRNVDWLTCDEYAVKNIAKVVCQFYEQDKSVGVLSVARHFGMDKSTVRKYLIQGTRFGWCTYSKSESLMYRELNKLKIQNERHVTFVNNVCQYYETHKPISSWEIAVEFSVDSCTVSRALKKGGEIGLCSYTPEVARKLRNEKIGTQARTRQNKKISVIKDDIVLRTYESVTRLCERGVDDFGITFSQGNVSSVARGERRQHKGFIFKYV